MTDLRHYDVIVSPVITEKSTMVSEHNQSCLQRSPQGNEAGNQGCSRSAVRRQGYRSQHCSAQG